MPLEVRIADAGWALQDAVSAAQVEVRGQSIDPVTGEVFLNLRLALCAPAAAAPLPPRPVPRRARTGPAVPADSRAVKSAMVCCHWKNKGWCRYEDGCRFLHPEHKRGIGALRAERSVPVVFRQPNRQQTYP